MKKIIIIALALVGTTCYAQNITEDKVPSEVKKSFKSKFPNAKEVKWEMEKVDFEAEFKTDKSKQSAVFNKEGKWLETETEIKVTDLPKVVSESIAKEFPGFKIDEAEKVESSENGKCFEVEVEKGKEEYEVLISESGKVLKKTKEEEDDKKED